MAAFRMKTMVECLQTLMDYVRSADIRGDNGVPLDLNPGSVTRTILEAAALNDADQYIQMAKLWKLRSLRFCKGDDLDEQVFEYGSGIWPELERRPAKSSIAQIVVGNGTSLLTAALAVDASPGSLALTVVTGEGAAFPTSGALLLEAGSVRSEEVTYTRIGDIFSIISPVTGTVYAHAVGASLTRVSVRSLLNASVLAAATTMTLTPGTGAAWAASGTVILERSTVREEKRGFTRVGDTLTLASGLTFAHNAGVTVIQATDGVDHVINTGTVCFVPATESTKQVNFRTQHPGVLYDGDFASALISVVSEEVGASTRVGSSVITQWVSAPFTGATVTNPVSATRGSDREKDGPYLQRVFDFIQSLTSGTSLSIVTAVTGVQDPTTLRTVEYAKLVEPVTVGESILYITDGSSTFAIDQIPFIGRDIIISDADANDRRGRLSQAAPFSYSETLPFSPRLFKSIERGVATSVGINYLEDTTKALIPNYYVGCYLKTDDDQFYEITSNTAIRFSVSAGGFVPSSGSYAIVDFATNPQISSTSTATAANQLTDSTLALTVNAEAAKWLTDSTGAVWEIASNTATVFTLNASGATPAAGAYTVTAGRPISLIPGTEFVFNRSNGDLELSIDNALLQHDCLVAASDGASPSDGAYIYSAGLGAHVQRLVNGDPLDFTNFRGLKSVGVQIRVAAPTVVSQTFIIKVVAADGYSDSDLHDSVSAAVQTYVNSVGDGTIILAEIYAAVMAIDGVTDCEILSPSSNIVVSTGQLVRIDDSHVEIV